VEVVVTRSVALAIPAETMWRAACRLDDVNQELAPWLRMTTPQAMRGRSIDELPPGAPVGRSWLLLGRLIPVDFDDLCLAEIEPPRRFLERSRMGSMSRWEHERTIEADGEGSCLLTDRLAFVLRSPLSFVPGGQGLARRVVELLFRHRHRRLLERYGSPKRR